MTPDYIMQKDEFCIKWYSIISLSGEFHEFFQNYNCSTAFAIADILPTDGVVSAYEMMGTLLLSIYQHKLDDDPSWYVSLVSKVLYANCSMCAPSVQVYYNDYTLDTADVLKIVMKYNGQNY